MAKCYLVAEVTITNPGPYVEYQQKVPAIVARYGGKYLTRAGAFIPWRATLASRVWSSWNSSPWIPHGGFMKAPSMRPC